MAQQARETGETRTQERRGVERAEASIRDNSSTTPFFKELDAIAGPSGSGSRAIAQMDRDGYTGRAEAREATRILDETKGSVWRHLPTASNELTRDDVKAYAAKTTLSDGERALSQRLLKDFDKISTHGTITPDDITKFEAREKQHGDFRNLYSKDSKGNSLYASVSDGRGGISGDKLDKKLADPSLSKEDRASLDEVNKLRQSTYSGWGSNVGDVSAGALRTATDTAGLTAQERTQGRDTKQAGPRSVDAQNTQAALADLTARPGGNKSLFDRVTDGNGGISMSKANDLLDHAGQNNLTAKNVETLKFLQQNAPIAPNFGDTMPTQLDLSKTDLQKLGADAGVDWSKISNRPATTRLDQATADRNRDFAHLFEKQNGGSSLYDKLKSPDGSLSIDKLDAAIKDPNTRGTDKHSLEYVRDLARDGSLWGKKDLTQADLLAKAREHNVGDSALRKGGFDTQAAERATAPKTSPTVDMTPAVQNALKVHKGEGYWHTAERLLSEAHKGEHYQPTQQEMKDLVTQLRKSNDNRTELNQNEVLKLEQPTMDRLFGK